MHPGGKREHKFTLAQAVKSGMLTEGQAALIRAAALNQVAEGDTIG